MAQRIHSFRFLERDPAKKQGRAALLMVLFVVLAMFILLQSLKFAGMIAVPGSESSSLHGVSAEAVAYIPGEDPLVHVTMESEYYGSGTARPWEENVSFLSFEVDSRKAAKIDRLVLSLGGTASDSDVANVQLSIDGEFFAERAFVDGKAVFNGIHVRLHPGNPVQFVVTGTLSDDVMPGHRVKVGFSEAEDFSVKSIVSEMLPTDVRFPMWGPAVSVIGDPI
ncbi:MAG: hypothetical protein R3B71_05435 [Candidatus Gracilibacteria bacterium]